MNKTLTFTTLKTDCFHLWFLCKSYLRISTGGKHIKILEKLLKVVETTFISNKLCLEAGGLLEITLTVHLSL